MPTSCSRRATQHAAPTRVTEIKQRSGNDAVDVMTLDLASLASVREFAAAFLDRYDRLDVLIDNAGLVLASRRVTEDGNEMTFQVNHLGHFLLDRAAARPPRRECAVPGDRRGVGRAQECSARTRLRRSPDVRAGTAPSVCTARRSSPTSCSPVSSPAGSRAPASRRTRVHPGFVASRFGRDGDTGLFGKIMMPLAAARSRSTPRRGRRRRSTSRPIPRSRASPAPTG